MAPGWRPSGGSYCAQAASVRMDSFPGAAGEEGARAGRLGDCRD